MEVFRHFSLKKSSKEERRCIRCIEPWKTCRYLYLKGRLRLLGLTSVWVMRESEIVT